LEFRAASFFALFLQTDTNTDTMSADQIAAQIQSTKSLCVSPSWLNAFLTSSGQAQRNIPASALTKTALFRVLASDFRESLSTNSTSRLPIDIYDPNVQERRLQGPIPAQVLDIEDIGTSLWGQVEAIERVERGEAVRGREIVRTVAVGEDQEAQENSSGNDNGNSGAPNASGSSGYGPHRLILQDAAGTKAVAIEMQRIEGITLEKLAIGAKLVLRNTTVARGMILLNPGSVDLLGGKIEALDKPWKEGRKARLLERITAMQDE
jgi:RecQ-mediated genome instability protein 1